MNEHCNCCEQSGKVIALDVLIPSRLLAVAISKYIITYITAEKMKLLWTYAIVKLTLIQ